MDNDFTLSIDYKGEQKHFEAKLVQFGYSYRIVVSVNDLEVYFEPDEERNFRIVANSNQDENLLRKVDRNVLRLLQEKLEAVLL